MRGKTPRERTPAGQPNTIAAPDPTPTAERPPLDVEDFHAEITSPWNRTEIELHFAEAHRRAWASLPGLDMDQGEEQQDPDSEEPPARWTRFVAFPLGTVRAARRMVSGGEDDLGSIDVHLRLDPGAEEGEITATPTASRHGAPPWCTELTSAFHLVMSKLAAAKVPKTVRGLHVREPALTAAAIMKSGWADDGAEEPLRALDQHWNAGVPLDLPRLLAAIERGERHYRAGTASWGVVRHGDGSVRLLFPLVSEVFRVELPWRATRLWHAARYWLAVDIQADGKLDSMSIRTDRDGTWDAEGDDDGDGSLFTDRLDETSYSAATWIMEDFRRPEVEEVDPEDESTEEPADEPAAASSESDAP
jgi:hypothetical protein